ncbi:hypothetical protein BC834DRAFT_108119 [Gloeopeniophorella convolvens]|nr:hypothetical protein BC834DRAFT_108119 [Gloeopeniophorella convolvens]
MLSYLSLLLLLAAGAAVLGTDSPDCTQELASVLANHNGDSPCKVARALNEPCRTSNWTIGANSDCTCNRVFYNIASACLLCRSENPILLPYDSWTTNCTTPFVKMKVYPFQDALKTADVPGWAYDDSGDTFDLASALQPSHAHGWTAVQVLTPILVAVALCLIFALYILHRKGRLARLASMLPSMRSHRQGRRPRGWADDGDPSGVDSHDTPDAEAAPMIADQPHRWNSLSSRDVSNHQHHGLPAQGMVTRVFQAVFRSLRGLFGKGPVQVSHRSDPDSFDIEDSDSEIDPFDTLRTRSSKSRGIGIANYGTNGASAADLIASTHNFFRPGEVTRPRGSPDPTDDHHEYDDFLGGIQDPSLDGHSSGMATGDSVLLISRNGRDFSIRGSIATSRQSTLIGRPVLEEDRRSMDVVPPTPTKSGQVSTAYLPAALCEIHASRVLNGSGPVATTPGAPRPPSSSPLLPKSLRHTPASLLRNASPATARIAHPRCPRYRRSRLRCKRPPQRARRTRLPHTATACPCTIPLRRRPWTLAPRPHTRGIRQTRPWARRSQGSSPRPSGRPSPCSRRTCSTTRRRSPAVRMRNARVGPAESHPVCRARRRIQPIPARTVVERSFFAVARQARVVKVCILLCYSAGDGRCTLPCALLAYLSSQSHIFISLSTLCMCTTILSRTVLAVVTYSSHFDLCLSPAVIRTLFPCNLFHL